MNIKCGHCDGTHPSVADVRACAEHHGDAPAGSFLGLGQPEDPSEAQLNYAHALLRQRVPYGLVADAEETNSIEAAHEYISGMSKADIGEFISTMKTQPKRETAPDRPQPVQVGEGMYMMDNEIYKVQRAVHGSGHLYAKRLIPLRGGDEGDGPLDARAKRGNFVFEPGAISLLRPEHKMSLDEAKEFGSLYGWCCACGRTLTDDKSIAAGIGPVCAAKEWWY